MARAFLVGRILVGCFYLQSAFHHFTNVGPLARSAAAHGVPAPDRDPMHRQNDLLNFTKNFALLGSSLMFLAVPRPWPYSVERRLHLPVRGLV